MGYVQMGFVLGELRRRQEGESVYLVVEIDMIAYNVSDMVV